MTIKNATVEEATLMLEVARAKEGVIAAARDYKKWQNSATLQHMYKALGTLDELEKKLHQERKRQGEKV